MYELIEVTEYMMTRHVKLKNLETGEIEKCFDDSDVQGERDFYFMKMNEVYDCKICLLGEPVDEDGGDGAICIVINREVKLGKKMLVEVEVHNNRYFIPQTTVKEFLNCDNFRFHYFRKDLIQVNDVIHGHFL